MTFSTENATPPKSTKSRNTNSSVQIQIKPKSLFDFVLRDAETVEFLDLVDFGGAAISMQIVSFFPFFFLSWVVKPQVG